MALRSCWLAIAAGLISAGMIAQPAIAHAESGRLNLHFDLGIGMPVLGEYSSFHYANSGPVSVALGATGMVGLDWQFLPPVALELLIGGGYYFPTSFAPNGAGTFSAALGARVRFVDNQEGYGNEPGGDYLGNFWLSSHVGYHFFDSHQFGWDLGAGYEWSVVKPLQIGLFARATLLFDFQPNRSFDATVVIGASFSLELAGRAPAVDSDRDGLSDERETNRYHTNPSNPDTDGDGLNDGLEAHTRTNPTEADTDRDGLNDGVEDANHNGEVNDQESDPREADTDHGGVTDGWEAGHPPHNPRNAQDDDSDGDHVLDDQDACPGTPRGVEVDQRGCAILRPALVLDGINFEFNSAAILPTSEATLERAAEILRENPTVRVEVGGHTDNVGGAAFNLELSRSRATAVREWLVSHGIEAARLTVRGYGMTHPRGSNDTEEGRAQNRRIEFRRLDR